MILRPIAEVPEDDNEKLYLLYGTVEGEMRGKKDAPQFAVGFWSEYSKRWLASPTEYYTVQIDPTHFAELPQEPIIEGANA